MVDNNNLKNICMITHLTKNGNIVTNGENKKNNVIK